MLKLCTCGNAASLNVIATTQLAPGIAVLFLLRPRYKNLIRFSPLLVAVAISVVSQPSISGAFVYLVLVGVIAGPAPVRNRWTIAAAMALGLMILFDLDSARPRGPLYKNASSAGESLALLALALNAPYLSAFAGLTGSRTPLLVLAVAVRPSVRTVFPVILWFLGFLVWFWLHPAETASRVDLVETAQLRAETVFDWRQGWFGSGVGRFPGYQNPHNAVLSMWAQLGILAVPVWVTLAWQGRRIPWRVSLPLLPSLMLSDWLVSTPGGIATVAVYLGISLNTPAQIGRGGEHDTGAETDHGENGEHKQE